MASEPGHSGVDINHPSGAVINHTIPCLLTCPQTKRHIICQDMPIYPSHLLLFFSVVQEISSAAQLGAGGIPPNAHLSGNHEPRGAARAQSARLPFSSPALLPREELRRDLEACASGPFQVDAPGGSDKERLLGTASLLYYRFLVDSG